MKKFLVGLIALIQLTASAQDVHGHLNVGAAGTNQNDALIFDEPEIFETASGYVKTLVYTNTGRFAGFYVGNITLTALAATEGHPAYAPHAAAFGSWIFAELASVEGPANGAFAFWENGATNPTISLATGATGTNVWRLSESDGSLGSDPYGHLHGRRFTATLPGIYTVTFHARDLSTNGAGGGSIHAPSSALKIFFQAGVNIKAVEPRTSHTLVTYSAPSGRDWIVEASDSLGMDVNWTSLGTPIAGDDYFHEVTDETPANGQRFYRLRGQ